MKMRLEEWEFLVTSRTTTQATRRRRSCSEHTVVRKVGKRLLERRRRRMQMTLLSRSRTRCRRPRTNRPPASSERQTSACSTVGGARQPFNVVRAPIQFGVAALRPHGGTHDQSCRAPPSGYKTYHFPPNHFIMFARVASSWRGGMMD